MPLPVILGIGAGIAALSGVGTGIKGGVKMKEANSTMNAARFMQEEAVRRFEKDNKQATEMMDSLGTLELEILEGFNKFADLMEKIQGRPEFKDYYKEGVMIPKYDAAKLREVSVGAGLLIGSLGGAAFGTAGGFAAAGAATSAVIALGTASTGTTIATLSGAALTNATLAALGGGAVAAGGGGIALGTTILGATTLGVGLLVGGIIFNVTGSKLSEKAEEALKQAQKTKDEVNSICAYLTKLMTYAGEYKESLLAVRKEYQKRLEILDFIINYEGRVNWSEFTSKDKTTIQNTVLLVGMLYKMCQLQLVLKDDDGDGKNTINAKGIMDIQMEAETLLDDVA